MILLILVLAACATAVAGAFRRKSFEARRFFNSMKRKLFLDAFLRFFLEIYLRLTH